MNNNDSECESLEKSLRLATDLSDNVIESNDFKNALQLLEPLAEKSLYHSSLRSILMIFNACLTLTEKDLERAQKSVAQTYSLRNELRRNSFFTSLVKLFKTTNYDKYTDMNLHADLMYATFLGTSAILCALEVQNGVYTVIKIANRLRLCVNAFKECYPVLYNKTNWESELSQMHFEAGARFANGLKHLFFSHIPPKLLIIFNIFGYKGVERRGFQELNKSAFELPGFSSRLAQIVLVLYKVGWEPHLCLGPKELTLTQETVDRGLKRFPNSLLLLLAKGKLSLLSGRVDEAIETFENCLIDNKYETTHKLFQTELIFCFALKCQWTECLKFAQLVRKRETQSPALYTYLVALFYYEQYLDENDPELKQMATDLFRAIPGMRVRYFGKTMSIEKSVIETSKMYFKNNENLVLPLMDALYIGNHIYFIKNNDLLLNKHMKRIEREVNRFEEDLNNRKYLDNYLTALFYKAFVLKLMGRFNEAKDCLNKILKDKNRFEFNFSIPVQTVLELGLIELAQGNYDGAEVWFRDVINNYSGYRNENFIQIKAYAALRELDDINKTRNE